MLWHHSRSVEDAPFAVVHGQRRTETLPPPRCSSGEPCDWNDEWHWAFYWEALFEWLAERVGFWPIFLSVGASDDDRLMTGYSNQWLRRPPATIANAVLFSYASEPDAAAYSDYGWWHCVLNGLGPLEAHRELERVHAPSPYEERMILKRSWSRSRWLGKAASDPHSVQAVVPRLDLRAADEVWCRNQTTRRELLRRGFSAERVHVRRLPVLR